MNIVLSILLTFFMTSHACAETAGEVASLLKSIQIKTVKDLKETHVAYKKALPFMGSKGDKKVNIEVIKLYARTLKVNDYLEHIETIYPKIEKEPDFFKKLIKKEIKNKKDVKKILENIKDYAEFVKRGNG